MADKNDNHIAAKRDNSSEGGGAVPAGNLLAAMFALFDPHKVAEGNLKLFNSFWEIGMGTSEIAADLKDTRFANEAWESNPMYRRLSQAYLATCEAVDAMVPEGPTWDITGYFSGSKFYEAIYPAIRAFIENGKVSRRSVVAGSA